MAERSISFQRIKSSAKAEYGAHSKLALINILAAGLACLVQSGQSIDMASEPDFYEFMNSSITQVSAVPLLMYYFMAALGAIVCAMLFKDLSNRQTGDVIMAMPMSASERFFAKLLTLTCLQILPMIGSMLISLIIEAICLSIGGLSMEWLAGMAYIYLIALAAALFVDAMAVFCCCCTGSYAESIYFTGIFAIALSLLPSIISEKFMADPAGVLYGGVLGIRYPEVWTLANIFNMMLYGAEPETMRAVMLGINCVISIIVMTLCVSIYKKRDGKTVGKPIAFKAFFEAAMLLVVFTVSGLNLYQSTLKTSFIFTAVAFIIINIIVTRAKLSFKNFFIWIAKYVGANALFLIAAYISYVTYGFGYADLKPKDLDKVADKYFNINMSIDPPNSRMNDGYVMSYFAETDEEEYHNFTNTSTNANDKQSFTQALDIVRKYVKRSPRGIKFFLNDVGLTYDPEIFSNYDMRSVQFSGSYYYLTEEDTDNIEEYGVTDEYYDYETFDYAINLLIPRADAEALRDEMIGEGLMLEYIYVDGEGMQYLK